MASKRKMLRALVVMAAADGTIDGQELALLQSTCRSWGLEQQDLQAAIVEVQTGDKRLSIPKDPEGRSDLLRSLIAVAAVDGVIEKGERKMLEAVARKIGLPDGELEAMVGAALSLRDSQRRAAAAQPIGATHSDSDLSPVPARRSEPSPDASTSTTSPRQALMVVGVLVVIWYFVVPTWTGLSKASQARARGEQEASYRADKHRSDVREQQAKLNGQIYDLKRELETIAAARAKLEAETAHHKAEVRRAQKRIEKTKPKQAEVADAEAKLELRKAELAKRKKLAEAHVEKRQRAFEARFGKRGG